jgi:HK97 family phage major capsid protein
MSFPDVVCARANFTLAGTGISSIDKQSMIQQVATETPRVQDLMAHGTTNAKTVRYLEEQSFTNDADVVAEEGEKPEITLDLNDVDVQVRKCAGLVTASDEMLADEPAAAGYLNMRLRFCVEEIEELEILTGDNTGEHLQGILNKVGVLTQALGGDDMAACIRKAITKVQATGKANPSGIVIHPNDFETLQLTRSSDGVFLIGNIFIQSEIGALMRAPTVWGVPCIVTSNCPEHTAVVGDWRNHSMLWRRQGLQLDASNSDGDNFRKNLTTFRAESRLAAGWLRPSAFCLCTGL